MGLRIKRWIAGILGFKPIEDYEVLLEDFKRIEESNISSKSLTDTGIGTKTRINFYQELKFLFEDYKNKKLSMQDTHELKEEIISCLYQIDSRKYKFPLSGDFSHSIGKEGGTDNIQSVGLRFKKTSLKGASDCSIAEACIAKSFPEIIGFGDAFDIFYLQEDFPGKKLLKYNSLEGKITEEKAPPEIIFRYLDYALKMSAFKPQPDHYKEKLDYCKENYRKKVSENLSTLSVWHKLSSEAIKAYADIAWKLEDLASDPFWDRSLANAKYREEEIKAMDFSRVGTLVVPCYEAVQIAYGYGESIQQIKDIARRYCKHDDFAIKWELGAMYYLTRQIRNAYCDMESEKGEEALCRHLVKRHMKFLALEEFIAFPDLNLVARDIKKSI